MKEELESKLNTMQDALSEAKLARDDIDDLIELIHFNIDAIKEELERVDN
jgi:hypothetical protein